MMEDKTTKTMMAMMMAVVLGAVAMSVVTPLGPQYECPVCGVKFYTYDELYQHFIGSHPTEPIEIIWD